MSRPGQNDNHGGSYLDRRWWMTLSLFCSLGSDGHSPELFLVHYIPQELFWFNVLFPMAVPHTGSDHWKCNEPKKNSN